MHAMSVQYLRIITLMVWVITFESGMCEVLSVPGEYPTIQTALDSSASGDTILVAPGVYHEFLLAPAHSLTLSGWYSGDTLPEFRTVLDPIPTGLDTPSAAVFSGDSVSIMNFAFYNRPEYRAFGASTRTGGVHFNGVALFLKDCRFDSVSRAIKGGDRIYARRCIFDGCFRQCIMPDVGAMVDCHDCSFDGEGLWFVWCYSGSTLRNCTFRCNRLQTEFVLFHGSNITIADCRFGPCVSAFPVVSANPIENCIIENCVFEGIERASSMIWVLADCGVPSEHMQIRIRGNTFTDYHGISPATGTTAIIVDCDEQGPFMVGIIEDNVFMDGSSNLATGIMASATILAKGNLFLDLLPVQVADVRAYHSITDTLFARDNEFYGPGIAAVSSAPYFDARENWWGDSTGPYHPNLNPNGLGTEVGNGVVFEPWLTMHPDSSEDTTEVESDRLPAALPQVFSLNAFPNPFNGVTTLSFTLGREQAVEIRIFDLLGKQVESLVNERFTAGTHHIMFEGSELPSGLYFARLVTPQTSTTAKLILLK